MSKNPYDSDEARDVLADAISKQSPSSPVLLPVSNWVAMSCLQKGIRRGREDIALRAAATLLANASERLWGRCCGIAFEDIGVADLHTVSIVMAALAGKRFRNSIGGDWTVARFIVIAMCRAAKCRSADDLLMTAELHPAYAPARAHLPMLSTSELLALATGSDPLPIRAIAAWYAAGTYWRNTRHLRPRRGEPHLLFDHLSENGYPLAMGDLAREGFRKGAGMLAPFFAMLSQLQPGTTETEADAFPPEIMIGDVPSWALDIYSREGRASLEVFLNGDSPTATWVRTNIPPSQRLRFLGGLLFRVEGGLVTKRRRWDVGDELRRAMDVECHGSYCLNATEALHLIRIDIPFLNEIRVGALL